MSDVQLTNLITCFVLSELAMETLEKLGIENNLPIVNKEINEMINVNIGRSILTELV